MGVRDGGATCRKRRDFILSSYRCHPRVRELRRGENEREGEVNVIPGCMNAEHCSLAFFKLQLSTLYFIIASCKINKMGQGNKLILET